MPAPVHIHTSRLVLDRLDLPHNTIVHFFLSPSSQAIGLLFASPALLTKRISFYATRLQTRSTPYDVSFVFSRSIHSPSKKHDKTQRFCRIKETTPNQRTVAPAEDPVSPILICVHPTWNTILAHS